MASLLVENIPNDLYAQLKQMAEKHHRSLDQEAVQCLKGGLTLETSPCEKPSWEEFALFMQDAWAMPIVDTRSADEIMGYNANGLFD